MPFLNRLYAFFCLYIILGSSVLLSSDIYAKSGKVSNTTQIADLSKFWLYYNSTYNAYVYYNPALVFDKPTALGFLINKKKLNAYLLQLYLESQSCVYLNDKLVFYTPTSGLVNFDFKSEQLNYSVGDDSAKLWILVFQPFGRIHTQSLFLVNTRSMVSISKQIIPKTGILRSRIIVNENAGRLLFALCLGLGLMVLRHFYYRDFKQIISIHSNLNFSGINYSTQTYRIFTGFNLLLVLINLIGLTYIIWILTKDTSWIFFQNLSVSQYFSKSSDVFSYLNVFLIVITYLVGKYNLIWVFSRLFDLQSFSSLHYYEFIRSSSRLFLILLACFLFSYLPDQISATSFLELTKIFILGSIIVRIVQVGILLVKESGFKKIYLFSYLCATEIIPMAFLGKVLQ